MSGDVFMRKANDVALVVPAAGRGTRLGGRRKQLRELGGAPVLTRTLNAFAGLVDTTVVAGPPDEPDVLTRAIDRAETSARAVAGGASRQASVAAALRAVPEDIEMVLVHDAVRPFVQPERIEAVVAAAREHGGASLALPVADTLRRADDGETFGETVARDGLYRMQTPQGFRRAWLDEAHEQAEGRPATDDVELVQRQGRSVRVVGGDVRNFKITTPDDWAFARQLWPVWCEGVKVDLQL
jgi:2-C-methyl-D-erythritol 4-phosphate cytidylyltransferase